MLIKNFKDCEEFIAGDNTLLREILHPDRQDLKIGYSLAYALVKAGQTTRPHRLKSSEVYYILDGNGIVSINGENTDVHSGQAIYIPPGAIQYIRNTGNSDLKFLCVVDPAWRAEDEELL